MTPPRSRPPSHMPAGVANRPGTCVQRPPPPPNPCEHGIPRAQRWAQTPTAPRSTGGSAPDVPIQRFGVAGAAGGAGHLGLAHVLVAAHAGWGGVGWGGVGWACVSTREHACAWSMHVGAQGECSRRAEVLVGRAGRGPAGAAPGTRALQPAAGGAAGAPCSRHPPPAAGLSSPTWPGSQLSPPPKQQHHRRPPARPAPPCQVAQRRRHAGAGGGANGGGELKLQHRPRDRRNPALLRLLRPPGESRDVHSLHSSLLFIFPSLFLGGASLGGVADSWRRRRGGAAVARRRPRTPRACPPSSTRSPAGAGAGAGQGRPRRAPLSRAAHTPLRASAAPETGRVTAGAGHMPPPSLHPPPAPSHSHAPAL